MNLAEYQPGRARKPGRAGALRPLGLTHTSNFREVKRVRDVVRVFARVRRALPATLLMIGDGPDRADAEQEARELQVARTSVPRPARLGGRPAAGKRTVPPPFADEWFGLAALEAMACGAAVVATRVGGIPEVVEDGIDGILEPPGSVEAMARRAVELLRDRRRAARMRAAAIAGQGVLRGRIVPMYEALYAEVVRVSGLPV